ncbi:MAG: hypothetical protein OHK0039_07890 [Bacteroidia bacterium]
MILRIVRMEFRPETTDTFHRLFDQYKIMIAAVPGCLRLELYEDADHPQVRYTYSWWADTASLAAYRQSALFGQVWPATKQLFARPPQAFSLRKREEVSPDLTRPEMVQG